MDSISTNKAIAINDTMREFLGHFESGQYEYFLSWIKVLWVFSQCWIPVTIHSKYCFWQEKVFTQWFLITNTILTILDKKLKQKTWFWKGKM